MLFKLQTFTFEPPNYCVIHYTLTDILLAGVHYILHCSVYKQDQVAALNTCDKGFS
jgi:hypothetical protein